MYSFRYLYDTFCLLNEYGARHGVSFKVPYAIILGNTFNKVKILIE